MLLRIRKYAIIVSPEAGGAVLLLKDETSDAALPIGIDLRMGRIISDLMKRIPRKRPWTHDLIGKILSECGARLDRVAIKDRKHGVYSAVIHIKAQGREIELHCRPSDAIAIALRTRSAILIPEELLDRLDEQRKDSGVELSPGTGATFADHGDSTVH